MGSRTTENAAAPAAEEAVAAPQSAGVEPLRAGPEALTPRSVLLLQRAIGNAAVARVVRARPRSRDASTARTSSPTPSAPTRGRDAEVRAIQPSSSGSRLYDIRSTAGRGAEARTRASARRSAARRGARCTPPRSTRSCGAQRPRLGRRHALHWSELFRDGVLDVTFGVGLFEGDPAGRRRASRRRRIDALGERGYTEDAKQAAELLAEGRPPARDAATGRFFVKENAFTYAPPAGTARPIHSIVRVVYNDVARRRRRAAAAFREGMTSATPSGTPATAATAPAPTSTATSSSSACYDAEGNLEQTLDDYVGARGRPAQEPASDPWQAFLAQRIADKIAPGRPLQRRQRPPRRRARTTTSSAPAHQLGARADQDARSRPAPAASSPEDAAKGPQQYRVIAFYGCSTNSYDNALRNTEGFSTMNADLLLTNRVTRGGAEVAAFIAFLDSFVGQSSAEKMLGGVNTPCAATRRASPATRGCSRAQRQRRQLTATHPRVCVAGPPVLRSGEATDPALGP